MIIPAIAVTLVLLGSIEGRTAWYVSRASGFTAYFLLTISVALGILTSTKLLRAIVPQGETFDTHQFASYLTLSAIGIHTVALLEDSWLQMSIPQLLFPGLSSYRPFAVGLGIVALYLLLVVTFSFDFRKRTGQKSWRALHYAAFPLWAMATVHGIFSGTDTATIWAQVIYYATSGIVLFLIFYRIQAGRSVPHPSKKPTRPNALDTNT